MDKTLHTFQTKLRQQITQQLEDNTRFAKAEPFEHGTQIGEWRGMARALNLLLEVLNDELEE